MAKKKKTKKKASKKAKKKKAKKKVSIKTQKTKASVTAFLGSLENDQQRKDAKVVAKLMRKATGARAKMWGPSIVGYGDWVYTRSSGQSGDWFEIGFSPRKRALTLYLLHCGANFKPLLKRLGKHTTGKGCLYIKKLADVDVDVLEEMIDLAVATRRAESA